jgi:hypothetical protein
VGLNDLAGDDFSRFTTEGDLSAPPQAGTRGQKVTMPRIFMSACMSS